MRPAIWSWSWKDALPKVLGKGRYRVRATVTLRRGGKAISTTVSTGTTRIS